MPVSLEMRSFWNVRFHYLVNMSENLPEKEKISQCEIVQIECKLAPNVMPTSFAWGGYFVFSGAVKTCVCERKLQLKNVQMRAGKIRLNLVADAVRCSIFNGKQEETACGVGSPSCFFTWKLTQLLICLILVQQKEVNTFQTSHISDDANDGKAR